MLEEARAEVAAGASDSYLDYDFTGCNPVSGGIVELFESAGRAWAVVEQEEMDGHSSTMYSYRVATSICGRIAVSTKSVGYSPNSAAIEFSAQMQTPGEFILHFKKSDQSPESMVVSIPANECFDPPSGLAYPNSR